MKCRLDCRYSPQNIFNAKNLIHIKSEFFVKCAHLHPGYAANLVTRSRYYHYHCVVDCVIDWSKIDRRTPYMVYIMGSRDQREINCFQRPFHSPIPTGVPLGLHNKTVKESTLASNQHHEGQFSLNTGSWKIFDIWGMKYSNIFPRKKKFVFWLICL